MDCSGCLIMFHTKPLYKPILKDMSVVTTNIAFTSLLVTLVAKHSRGPPSTDKPGWEKLRQTDKRKRQINEVNNQTLHCIVTYLSTKITFVILENLPLGENRHFCLASSASCPCVPIFSILEGHSLRDHH